MGSFFLSILLTLINWTRMNTEKLGIAHGKLIVLSTFISTRLCPTHANLQVSGLISNTKFSVQESTLGETFN